MHKKLSPCTGSLFAVALLSRLLLLHEWCATADRPLEANWLGQYRPRRQVPPVLYREGGAPVKDDDNPKRNGHHRSEERGRPGLPGRMC